MSTFTYRVVDLADNSVVEETTTLRVARSCVKEATAGEGHPAGVSLMTYRRGVRTPVLVRQFAHL